jgi:hypothetical protein
MRMRLRLVPFALALIAAGCADYTGPRPPAVQQPANPTDHLLRWAGTTPPEFSATGDLAHGVRSDLRGRTGILLSTGELSLDQNVASFWAVRGEQRSVQINYLSFSGDTNSPFLRITIDDPDYVPGVGQLAVGDSVLITVVVDPENIKVSLLPTGLTFGNSAELTLWYGGAEGDLNGDGAVDEDDASIETQLLGMWCRETEADPWTALAAIHSLSEKSFTSALAHFSDYAVSW